MGWCGFSRGSWVRGVGRGFALASLALPVSVQAFILEGQDVSPEDPISGFAVQVLRHDFDPASFGHAGGTRVNSCSGSLVAPDLVLTAAHCLGGRLEVRLFDRSPRRGLRRLFQGPTRLRVIGEIAHPQYSEERLTGQDPLRVKEPLDHDLALLRLERPVPHEWHEPVVLATPELSALETGMPVIAAGYGTDRAQYGSNQGVGRLRRAELSFVQTLPSREDVIAGMGGSGICSGDSGGPLLVPDSGGRFRLWGVSSRVSDGCEGFGLIVRVAYHLAWIKEAARDLGSGLP